MLDVLFEALLRYSSHGQESIDGDGLRMASMNDIFIRLREQEKTKSIQR